MATQQELMRLLERSARRSEVTADAYDEVLTSEGEIDVTLSDGTVTPNLNKRIKAYGSQVTSVVGKKGDVTIADISEKLELGSAAKYNAADLPLSAAQKGVNKLGGVLAWDGGPYPLNGEVRLDNGDVVKSTVANNTKNPNWDMTGWVGETKRILSIKDYGAKYNESNDRQALIDCRAANKYFLVDTGTTNIEVFANQRHAVGLGRPMVIVNPTANPVAVQLLEGSVTENIDFISSSDSKEWQRAEIKSNSIVKNVGFYNFKHVSALPNAWGNYLENVRNISYENCRYGRNSQSDIAIVDNVQDVVINNAQNAEDGGVYLNIEPNNIGNISNINVIGGTYRKITLLENSANNYGISGVVVNGSKVKYLSYRGAEVSFINAQIDEIEGNFFGYSTVNGVSNAKLEFAGAISINNAALLSNKITDEYLTDLDPVESSAWEVYQSESGQKFERTNSDLRNGDYTTLNTTQTGYTYASTRSFIDVTESTTLAFINRARVNNLVGTINVEIANVRFYDAADTLLYTHIVYSNRGALGSNIGFRNDVAIIKKPAGATKAKVSLRSRPNCSVDIARVGLFDIRLNAGGGNFNSVVASFANPVKTTLKKSTLPSGTFGLMYKFNDILELPSGAKYRVVTSGTATTQGVFSLKYKRKLYASYASVSYTLSANEIRPIVRTVTGAKIGDTVLVAITQTLGSSSRVWAEVTASDTVTIYHQNLTAAAVVVLTTINIIVE